MHALYTHWAISAGGLPATAAKGNRWVAQSTEQQHPDTTCRQTAQPNSSAKQLSQTAQLNSSVKQLSQTAQPNSSAKQLS